MPIYTYRREDGTTFDLRQKFLDDPLTVDPETGQHVVRVIQPASVIFKGSGFYINDSKNASHSAVTGTPKPETSEHKHDATEKAETKPAASTSKESSKSSVTAGAAAD